MTIRTKIFLTQIVIALSAALIVAVLAFALWDAEKNRRHLQASHEQLQGIMAVKIDSNRVSEQVAELFIMGEDGLPDVREAQGELRGAIDRLKALISDEITFTTDQALRNEEARELERISAMREIIMGIDDSIESLRELLQAGRDAEAMVLFREAIEDRLDDELEALINESLTWERRAVDEGIRYSATVAERSTLLATAVAIITIGSSLAAGLVLHNTLSRPIALLVRGADAIGRGDLSHRIDYKGSDELGHMSSRFNAMADQLEESRGHLLRAQATLEEKVRHHTEQLRRQTLELEAANTRLKEVDSARVRFLADISHELRTPLTVLRGEAEVTLRGPAREAEGYRDTLRRVVKKAAQMGHLVDDLLFLARSEAGTIRFDMRKVLLQEVLAEVLLDSRVLSRRQQMSIGVGQPEDPIFVRGDPQRLKQSVLVVLDNAIKYSPTGSTVRVNLARRNGHAELTIADQGPGFTEQELAHAFDRFYRGRREGTRDSGGSGLGLPIAKWVVEKHEGQITLASVAGQGTELTIRLPVIEEA